MGLGRWLSIDYAGRPWKLGIEKARAYPNKDLTFIDVGPFMITVTRFRPA